MKPGYLLAALCLMFATLTPAPASSQNAFAPGGPTVSLAITGTTARVQVQSAASSPHMRIYNSGTVPAFITCGDVTAVATLAAGMPIAPASVEVIGCPQQYVAGISAGTAATIYITPGAGL
jgi:hypothetical protein